MRLIDADALFKEFEKAAWYNNMDRDEVAEEFLLLMPTIDAVTVVRCKDCKYHNAAPCPMRLSFNWTKDSDFCSYGERKDGDGNG